MENIIKLGIAFAAKVVFCMFYKSKCKQINGKLKIYIEIII